MRRVEVRGVKLDARKGGSGAQPSQLVLPLRTHVAAHAFERQRIAKSSDRGSATGGSKEEFLSSPDGRHGHGHDRPLAFRIEESQGLNHTARPFRAKSLIRRGRKQVE